MRPRRVGSGIWVVASVAVVATMVASSLAVAGAAWTGSSATDSPAAPTPAVGLTVTVSPSPASIDSGQSVALTATASGTAPYKGYQWWEGTYDACGASSGNRPILGANLSSYTTPALTSSEYFCVNVTDSESPAVNASSAPVLVTVNPTLSDAAVTPVAPVADKGAALTLTENVTGGTPAYTYQWYSGTSGACSPFDPISGATTASLLVSTTTVGSTSYCVVVGDHSATAWAGNRSASDTVTVDAAVVAPAPTPSGDYGDSGQTYTLTATPSGGTGTYSLQWLGGTSATCSSDSTKLGTARTQSVTPTTSPSYYCYEVKDTSVGATFVDSPTTEIVVNGTLTAGGITPSSVAFDLGTTLPETANLTANPSGGSLTGPSGAFPTYRYQWRSGTYPTCAADTNLTGQTNRWLDVSTTTVVSSTYFCYQVTDANATVAYSSPLLVVVNPALVAPTPTPASSQVDLGQSLTLSAPTPVGGTGTFSYQWFEGSGCTLVGSTWTLSGTLLPFNTSATLTVYPAANATYFYRVTDSSSGSYALGERSECSPLAAVTVHPALTPAAPSVSPTGAIDVGQTVTLTRTAVPAGEGTPVVTYAWLTGSSPTCSADQLVSGQTGTTYVPTPPPVGTTYYCYRVTDGSATPPQDYSPTIAVLVDPVVSAAAVTVASGQVPYVDAGPGGSASAESVTLVANPSGGTAPYTYQWYAGAAANCTADLTASGKIAGATGATYVASGLSSSTAFCYTVTDSASPPVVQHPPNAFLVTVEPQLGAGTPTASVASLDLGQSVALTATPSGGYFPTGYTAIYQWFSATAAACTAGGTTLSLLAGATSSPVTIAPTAAGTSYFCYRVSDDSNGNPVQQSALSTTAVSVKVNPTLSAATGPTCEDFGAAAWTGTFTSCSNAKAGDHVTLIANPSGGNTAEYAYRWYNGTSTVCASDPAMTGATGSSINVIVPATPGNYYCYSVNDGSLATPLLSPTYFLDPPSAVTEAPALLVAADPVAGTRT